MPYVQPHPEFVEQIRGQLILAPLTKYGNVPFRRLCADFGADVTMGEMMFAKELLHPKNRHEKARLRRAANEKCFGASSIGRHHAGKRRSTLLHGFDGPQQHS